MDQLIEIVNQLQDVFAKSGTSGQELELPQVLVVGAQSSGKSSVLEHIVGKSFLPRGAGVVTRCPLVLQILHNPYSDTPQEYAVFNHRKRDIFTDYDQIRQEIEEETIRLAGANKGICKTPIVLKLYSSSFLNLTLVDLPGITKVPVGDQPRDIEYQTRDLILTYAKNPNSILLAVSPANADLATSESLKLAREVDPAGERTLAVITKLDLMDDGTDGFEMLNGKIIPVKLGIIGVVNRSQKDIIGNKSVEQSLKDESAFLNNKYKDIAAFHGTEYLKTSVQTILIRHIHNCLPKLKEMVNEKLSKAQSELDLLGDVDDADKQANLFRLLTSFSSDFCSAIKGTSTTISITELYGGARIKDVFQRKFKDTLKKYHHLEGLNEDNIKIAIKNASGSRSALFIPEVVFENLVTKQIMRLREPSRKCVDLVYNELLDIVVTCTEEPHLGLKKYPNLHQQLHNIMEELLKQRVSKTAENISGFIEAQGNINTSHADFIKMERKLLELKKEPKLNLKHLVNSTKVNISHEILESLEVPEHKMSSQDKDNQDVVKMLVIIEAYYSVVKDIIQDQVPKLIMHYMVNDVMKELQTDLMTKLYKSADSDLMEEASHTVESRRKLQAEVICLQQANSILCKLKLNCSSPSKKKCKNTSPTKRRMTENTTYNKKVKKVQ